MNLSHLKRKMFNDSTLTAEDIQARITRQRSETPSDDVIRDGIRYVVDLIDRERWGRDQSAMRKRTGALSVTSSGYDLSLITDLGDTEMNFSVFKDEIIPQKQLNRTDYMSQDLGYYIEGSVLYLTGETSGSVIISYMKKSPRITSDSLSDYTLPIPQQMEESVYDYLLKSYYDGRFQFELRSDAMNAFLAEISRVLSVKKRVAIV